MRFKEYLGEMTLVDPNVSDQQLEAWRANIELTLLEKGTHVGDIEEFKVLRIRHGSSEIFGICTAEELVSAFDCRFKSFPKLSDCVVVQKMITKKSWRGKNLTSKLITFLCTRERWNVVIDDLISPANKKNLEKIAKTDYSNAFWLEVKTGKLVQFVDDNGKYRQTLHHPETGWQIMFGRLSSASERHLTEYYSRFWEVGESRMLCGYENELVQDTD